MAHGYLPGAGHDAQLRSHIGKRFADESAFACVLHEHFWITMIWFAAKITRQNSEYVYGLRPKGSLPTVIRFRRADLLPCCLVQGLVSKKAFSPVV